jgi:hypothetical protein
MLSPPARNAILTRVQKSLSMRASCSGDQVEKDSSRRGSTPWQVCSHFDKAPQLSLLLSAMMTPPLRTLQQMAGYHCLANGDKRAGRIAVLRFVSFAAMPARQLEKASPILIRCYCLE